MERYNKSAMPVNAENYFKAHAGLELTTSKPQHYLSPLLTALPRQPQ